MQSPHTFVSVLLFWKTYTDEKSLDCIRPLFTPPFGAVCQHGWQPTAPGHSLRESAWDLVSGSDGRVEGRQNGQEGGSGNGAARGRGLLGGGSTWRS